MIPDYHIHTSRCGHASGRINEYVEEALKKGFEEIGFSDHIPMYWLPEEGRDPGLAMGSEDFSLYITEVLELREQYPNLGIRLGVEVDYMPGKEIIAAKVLSGHPLDYVIGSVHYIEGWGFDNPLLVDEYSRHDLEDLYSRYFELLCGAAESGLFDTMGHPDLLKKFGHRTPVAPLELYRRAAVAFARAGVCVEVNTSGLRVPAEEIYPSLEFLRLCRVEGVPAVTGSDAHAPHLVGADFSEARALLKEAGYKEVAMFRERKRVMVKI
ncbi:MAG: histidinol-phosphatase HisJ family protein [Desulfocucumaceae bacterium]